MMECGGFRPPNRNMEPNKLTAGRGYSLLISCRDCFLLLYWNAIVPSCLNTRWAVPFFCHFADLESFFVFFLLENVTLFFGPHPRQKTQK